MSDFKIGDVVRLKEDDESDLDVVVRGNTRGILLCVSECGNRVVRSWADKVVLVKGPDPHADIKQAIREVLLSDEFMTAFAAAWMKTPLPLAMQYDSEFEIVNSTELASMPEAKLTKAQSLADRTLKAIWQANDPMNEGGKE